MTGETVRSEVINGCDMIAVSGWCKVKIEVFQCRFFNEINYCIITVDVVSEQVGRNGTAATATAVAAKFEGHNEVGILLIVGKKDEFVRDHVA
ncbi:hypothetical protein DSECCO2_618220 [anaerobic digester metagenome]